MHEHFDLIIKLFIYECKTSQIFIHLISKIVFDAKCNSWIMNFITFKVSDSIYVQMLIAQKMWKNSLTHSSINVKH